MSNKEKCDIANTEKCPIFDDFYNLLNKCYRLENEKREAERKLKDLRKTIANNTVPYPESVIEYITNVVGNVRNASKWTMYMSAALCICMLTLCMMKYIHSDSLGFEFYIVLGMFIVILIISTIGYITIPNKYVFSFMVKDYIEHKKAEKVAEFYRLFPLAKEETNNNQDTNIDSEKS